MNPNPEPLPDRVVILGLLATLMLCFALVFWTVRLAPGLGAHPCNGVSSPPPPPTAP